MVDLLLDLADAVRKSGLVVVELDGWKDNYSGGAFKPQGVNNHHTGGYDDIGDTSNDLAYARWLAFQGRPPGVPPPLCNLALSAESVVYVCCAGNANHAGEARASGPMPYASDGNSLYVGIEAMNSGTQGWQSKGVDASGREITQYEGLVRLNAALNLHYQWPATHSRGHKETSTTGKWDPGGIDMDRFRRHIKVEMEKEEDMAFKDWPREDQDALARRVAREILSSGVRVKTRKGDTKRITIRQAAGRAANTNIVLRQQTDEVLDAIDALNEEETE